MKKAVVGALLVVSSLVLISCNDTTGYTCSDPGEDSQKCERTGDDVIYCIKNDLSDSYYKVGDKKFNCSSENQDCAIALDEYCSPED